MEENRAVFFHTSNKGLKGSVLEIELDDQFLDKADNWTLESYRSVGKVSSEYHDKLRCYFLKKTTLPCEAHYLTPKLLEDHKAMLAEMRDPSFHGSLLVKSELGSNSDHCHIKIAYKKRVANRFFSSLSDLYHYYDLYSTRKYVTPYEGGIVIMNIFLARAGNKKDISSTSAVIPQVLRDISLLFPIPDSPLHRLFREGKLSIQEVVFSYCGGIFTQHFFNRLGPEYEALKTVMDPSDVAQMAVLENIRQKLRASTMREKHIWEVLLNYPEVLKEIYVFFSQHHLASQSALSFSSQSSPLIKPRLSIESVKALLVSHLPVAEELALFQSVLLFADSVLKTNFFKRSKTALSFRLDPRFLRKEEFPDPLFGMFMVVGAEFRGFHLRFQDIARGGIRLIQSRSAQVYDANLRTLFDENYGLAHTQQRKNKDLPEGGSKGAILMKPGATNAEAFVGFKKYISALLDLLQESPEIVDRVKKQEILFFGPDEGTAEFMDWASQAAKRRGFSYWKALTTGKSPAMGGIPHDMYGMTTRSIHPYVLGVLEKLGLKESEVTKLQTGGPDGDLGSNEIKISLDKTIAIVDGSGVLYDPQGIDRAELVRLATARKMIDQFDVAKLSPKGFRVLVGEVNITTPEGLAITNGMAFRNNFHLHPLSSADIFVPCGGRPEAVNVSNVGAMYDAKTGKPRFKAVIEGANLFFSEQARLHLEKNGVIVIKDASANKGGVTSSSLEVLSALSLSDEAFMRDMCVGADGVVPVFRQKYVEEVIRRIEHNAAQEFACLWKEREATNLPLTVLSNRLSLAINSLTDELAASPLWDDLALRKLVLSEAIPTLLQEAVGLDTLMTRIPEPYLRAMFSSHLASNFVYSHGMSSSQMSFFVYMQSKMAKK